MDLIKRCILKLLDKKIVLLGSSEMVYLFYSKYKDMLNIHGWVDIHEPVATETYGSIYSLEKQSISIQCTIKNRIALREVLLNVDNYICILCQRGVGDNPFEKFLEWNGLEYFHHYIPSCFVEAILSHRQIVIFHGFYCFVRDLLLLMESDFDIASKYIFFVYPYDDSSLIKYGRNLNKMLNLCDYYVYNKEATGRLRYADVEIPKQVRKISFPCLNFGGLYPQINYSHYKYINPFYIAVKGRPDLGFKFGDNLINQMILSGKADNEILEYVNTGIVFSSKDIIAHFKKEMRCAELYEYDCDIKIVPALSRYYQKYRVVNCNDHWAEKILIFVAEQILHCMEYDVSKLSDAFIYFQNPHIYSEVPIYPIVGETLGIKWVNRDTRYNIRMANENIAMNFEEYVQHYCSYVRAVIELKNNEI